jgi:flagellar hook-associated protein 1
MSLGSALAIAMSGLRANQAALSIVSSNIANAQTPGYVTQRTNQVETLTGDTGASVSVTGVNRELDQFIQAQLRSETSGGAYADQMANVLTQLQSVYGTPGDAGTLEAAFANFTSALQSLSTNSGSASAQISAVTAAQSLAQQLNATTQGIQALRSNAEQDINISVGQANAAMTQIAQINAQLQGLKPTDPTAATLMDQRDKAIDLLSQLMDIRVTTDNTNQTTIYTSNGVELVGAQASQLIFNSQGTLNPNSQWNANPANSSVGSLSIKLANGATIDMIETNSISSGQIAADLRRRSISSRLRWRARCRTRRPTVPSLRPLSPQRPASILIYPACCRATASISATPTLRPTPCTRSRSCASMTRRRFHYRMPALVQTVR